MGFFSKLFGSKKADANSVESLLKMNIDELLIKGMFDLSYELTLSKNSNNEDVISVDFFGADEDLLKDRKGLLLDAFQLFLKRVTQHQFPEDKTDIHIDCSGYREESNQALIERAESLKMIAIEQGKSVYYRALPPKERKIVHQYLAQDTRVKSRSLGEGLYKKIKIYPAKSAGNTQDLEQEAAQD